MRSPFNGAKLFIPMSFRSLLPLAVGLLAALFSGACKSTDSGGSTEITNSGYFHLDPENEIATPDPMMKFEQRRYLHGAITAEEQREREGHYYAFAWRDEDRSPAVVRLEYRQEGSGAQVKVQEVAIDAARRKNNTYFQVTGEEYQLGGKVTAWRVSIVRGGSVVASDQSYLW